MGSLCRVNISEANISSILKIVKVLAHETLVVSKKEFMSKLFGYGMFIA